MLQNKLRDGSCTSYSSLFSQVRVRVIMFNTTFNNISVILVEENGVPGQNHRPAANR